MKILIKGVLSYDDYEKNYRVRQKTYSATSISVMRKNFEKLCKKWSVTLIGRDSAEFWLKKIQVWRHNGHRTLLGSYSIKISNEKKVLVTHQCEFFNQISPESLSIKLTEYVLNNFSKFSRFSKIEVEKYAFWRTL